MTTNKTQKPLRAGTVIWSGKRTSHVIRGSRRLSTGMVVYVDRNGVVIPESEITKVGI